MSKKKSNKKQGSEVSGASLSSTNQQMMPQMLQRGLGSSYAMAVSKAMDNAEQIKGSKNAFLGVEKVLLDPVEYGAYSLLKDNK